MKSFGFYAVALIAYWTVSASPDKEKKGIETQSAMSTPTKAMKATINSRRPSEKKRMTDTTCSQVVPAIPPIGLLAAGIIQVKRA